MGSDLSSADAPFPSAEYTDPIGEKVVPSTVYSRIEPVGSTVKNCKRGVNNSK